MSEPERFVVAVPVMQALAEDEAALVEFERNFLLDEWRRLIVANDGEPLGDPVVTREPNPQYGLVLGLTDDGEEIVDLAKIYLHVRGWARRLPSVTTDVTLETPSSTTARYCG